MASHCFPGVDHCYKFTLQVPGRRLDGSARENRRMDRGHSSALHAAAIRRRTFLLAALAAAGVLLPACTKPSTVDELSLPSRAWGAFLATPVAASRLAFDRFAGLAGAVPQLLHLYAALRDSNPHPQLDTIHRLGVTPVLTLEPWNPTAGLDQPEYSQARIASGQLDTELQRWAADLGSWGHPLLLRFGQEMNGTWYPWSVGIGENTASNYRAAWVRMHRIIAEQAPNVRFVWAPNVLTEGTRDFADCYPGDRYVDYLALDGYNWGDTQGHRWQSPDKLFTRSLSSIRQLNAVAPILITEVGCANGVLPGDKAKWITEFFDLIRRNTDVTGFLWFQTDKERDWRFNSTLTSTQAFRTGLAKWVE